MAVDQLIGELAADLEGYAQARKFSRKVTFEEAAEVAAFLHEQIDSGVAARDEAIAKSDSKLACTRGCNACCQEPIMVFRPESVRVARWLELPENAHVKATFLAAYPAWREQIGAVSDRLSRLFVADPKNYISHHVEAWRKGVLCAFNHNGDCTVYPVRPGICRTGHALETNAYCSGASEKPATRATFVPLDQFVARARRLLVATHNATRGDRGQPQTLPHAVYAMLQR